MTVRNSTAWADNRARKLLPAVNHGPITQAFACIESLLPLYEMYPLSSSFLEKTCGTLSSGWSKLGNHKAVFLHENELLAIAQALAIGIYLKLDLKADSDEVAKIARHVHHARLGTDQVESDSGADFDSVSDELWARPQFYFDMTAARSKQFAALAGKDSQGFTDWTCEIWKSLPSDLEIDATHLDGESDSGPPHPQKNMIIMICNRIQSKSDKWLQLDRSVEKLHERMQMHVEVQESAIILEALLLMPRIVGELDPANTSELKSTLMKVSRLVDWDSTPKLAELVGIPDDLRRSAPVIG